MLSVRLATCYLSEPLQTGSGCSCRTTLTIVTPFAGFFAIERLLQ